MGQNRIAFFKSKSLRHKILVTSFFPSNTALNYSEDLQNQSCEQFTEKMKIIIPRQAQIAMIVYKKFKKLNEIKQMSPYINREIFKSYGTTSHLIVKILIKKKQ